MGDGDLNNWEWECFEKWVTNDAYTVTDFGPLGGPVSKFLIRRDENLNLILETTSLNASSQQSTVPAGTVFIPSEQVKFESSILNTSAIAHGVVRKSRTDFTSESESESKEISSMTFLEGTLHQDREPVYIIEWFENMGGPFIWPHSFSDHTLRETRRIFHSPNDEIVLTSRIGSLNGLAQRISFSCAYISVEGLDLFVGFLGNIKVNTIKKPGFILYKDNPDEAIRSKIRECLSFSLGTYLIYLGFTSFDGDWSPVSFRAENASALCNDDHRLIRVPPAPLGHRFEWEINPEKLQKVVTALCAKYDLYNLQNAFWSYWHAVASPVHMTAVHFGAAIEALQNVYLKNHGTSSVMTTILDKKVWGDLSGKIHDLISALNASEEDRLLLSNKVGNLNRAPQDIIMDRFLDKIGIRIGEVEKSAWGNRNRGAHGGQVHDGNVIRIIRENKALRILMNRIILAITNGDDFYYDYYTMGRPTRELSEFIPNDRPDQ